MKHIPTVAEYFEKRYKELGINHVDEIEGEDEQIALEFAKLHVKAALKKGFENNPKPFLIFSYPGLFLFCRGSSRQRDRRCIGWRNRG